MLEACRACRLDELGQQRAADAAPACLGPDVDIRHMRCPPAVRTEHAEHESERTPVLLLGDQRHALVDRGREVFPRLVPVLAQVRLLVEPALELLPQLAQGVVVVGCCRSNRHR